jgi:O-antigen/teichoic acid export membrane protein
VSHEQRAQPQLRDLAERPEAPRRQEQLSIERTLLASGVARLVGLPVTGVSNLIIARLITDAVGIEQFGAVMLIATLSQLLTFADLGAGAAVATASVQMDGGPAHTEQFRRTLLTALRTMLCSAGVLGLIAVGVGLFADWSSLLGIHDSETGSSVSVNVAAVVALLAFSASLPFALGEPVLRGSGRLHQAVLLTALSAPGALILTLALYALDWPPFAYALAIPLGALFGAMCCGAVAVRAVRGLVAGLGRQLFRPRRFPGAAIAATAVPMFVVMIGLPVALQSDRIIISHRVDAAGLSDYSYAAQLYTPIWSVISVAALALWPVFAARNNSGVNVRRRWLTCVALLGSAGLVSAIVFLLLGGVVIGWMSGGTATLEFPLLLSFAALLVVQSLHVGTGIMLISPRQLRFQSKCVVALVVTNVPLSWFLAPLVGPAGPVIASVVTVAICQLLPGVVVARRVTATPLPCGHGDFARSGGGEE